jgi:hypothetical protein
MLTVDMKKICLALINAESEEAVDAILASIPEMKDPKNWVPLDRRETNYNVTTNQQASGPKAATELMTNMVDAVLLKHARMKGLDPRGKGAPDTMYEAVERFFGLKGGRMINESNQWLSDFAAKNLIVGISGARSKREGFPCYTFADNGEGQNAEEFEDTFLSLSKGNKKDIRFVQGKFNMGSSGVLSYCGRRWYKLIVSRKWDQKKPWGWTLMRRRPGGGMPVAEYFKPGGEKGKILTADMDMVFPLKSREGKRYDGFSLGAGTIVKLYDFQIGSKFLSFRGAREALNEHLVDTILPFRILDLRQTPDPERGGDRALGIDARPFYGMEYLLLRSHADEDGGEEGGGDDEAAAEDEKIGVDVIDDPTAGRIEIHAIRLKRKLPKWLEDSNNRVFHSVNGQVQFKQTRGYLTTCKLPALKDRVVIIVDASRLSYEAHNDIWKSDRESIRETIEGERYKERVRESVQNSEILQKLQSEIAKQELQMAVDEHSNDLFQKLVDRDKTLAALLGSHAPAIRIPGGSSNANDEDEKPYDGKYSPTYIALDRRYRERGIDLAINKSKPIGAETDVRNDYFVRDENQGRLWISDESVGEKFVVRRSLRNGRLTVYLNPVEGRLNIGDSLTFRIGLQDDAMAEPVSDEITVRIVAAEAEKPKEKSQTPPKVKKPNDKPNVGLPAYTLLTSDGRIEAGQPTKKWPGWMNDTDGGYVEDLGEDRKRYFINYDNTYHQSYRRNQRGQIAKDSVSQKYILGMRVFMLGVERALNGKAGDGEDRFDPDEFRKIAAKGAAATMLTLSDHLPKVIQPIQDQPE